LLLDSVTDWLQFIRLRTVMEDMPVLWLTLLFRMYLTDRCSVGADLTSQNLANSGKIF